MSKSFDLKTHMDKSSIKELIKYIDDRDTPPSCNDIYTIARGIQYMDDTYLRANTTFATVKTPVPYNEWFKCMVGKFVAKQSAITQHRIHTDRPKDNDRIIKEENAINAENELNFCKKKGCRKSEGLGICFPKSRKLNDKLSKETKNNLQTLYDAIKTSFGGKDLDNLAKLIGPLLPPLPHASTTASTTASTSEKDVEMTFKTMQQYVRGGTLEEWKTCVEKESGNCDMNCAIGDTPGVCRPKKYARNRGPGVEKYIIAYNNFKKAVEKAAAEKAAEKYKNELTMQQYVQNQKKIASNINSGFDPLGVKLVGNAAVDDSHLPKYAPPRIPPVLSSLDSNAPTSGYDLSNGNRWRDPQPQPPHVRKLGGGRQTRKRKGSSSTKKHKKRTKHKKRASTKKHKKNKKRPRTRKR